MSDTMPEILCAVEQHRRRLAGLLDGLDLARRAAAEAGTALLAGDGTDVGSLLDLCRDDLQASDHRLQSLVAALAHRP
ncbi:MAG TPA: hypothetical protein VGO87_12100 [Acidimicrobiia bacterium]